MAPPTTDPGDTNHGAYAGFFPFVVAGEMKISKAGLGASYSKGDTTIWQGGGQVIGAGNNVSISEGGGFVIGAGNKVTIDRGGAALAGGRNVDLQRSYVGVVLGKEVRLDDETRPVLAPIPSVLVAVIFGVIIGFLGRRRA